MQSSKWEGMEELPEFGCAIVGFVIDFSDEEGNAKGKISCIDHAEPRVISDDPWTARVIICNMQKVWFVFRSEDGDRSAWLDKATGESVFTLDSKLNKAIADFIVKQLEAYTKSSGISLSASRTNLKNQ
ncbi:MAG: hypothetical protein NTW11_03010 [Candidatus Staskawiczbacteria bacterium]|nr:hypothetical protein [Candidatus Staskawiczbacteria bacterium]